MVDHSELSLQPTIYHSQEWISSLQRVYGYERLDAASGGFSLPLLRVAPIFGDRLISIPFSDYGGPVGTVHPPQLASTIRGVLEQSGGDYVEIRTSSAELAQSLEAQGLSVAATYFARVVETHPEEEGGAWKLSLDKKARQGVAKAEKAGVEASEARTRSELQQAYQVYFRAVKAIGSPCHPFKLFTQIKGALGERAKIYVATKDGEPLGMALYLAGYDRVHLWARYSLDEYKSLGVVYLLDWTGIELAAKMGLPKFDFGRTRKNSGVEVYKHHWRGVDNQIYHLCASTGGHVRPPDPQQSAFKAYSALWRRLPDPLARRFGPRVIRCIAL